MVFPYGPLYISVFVELQIIDPTASCHGEDLVLTHILAFLPPYRHAYKHHTLCFLPVSQFANDWTSRVTREALVVLTSDMPHLSRAMFVYYQNMYSLVTFALLFLDLTSYLYLTVLEPWCYLSHNLLLTDLAAGAHSCCPSIVLASSLLPISLANITSVVALVRNGHSDRHHVEGRQQEHA